MSPAGRASIAGRLPPGIALGTDLTAFGKGITVSRCFQAASLASADGYSGPLVTMAGVMMVTIGLSSAGGWLEGGASLVQILAFGAALITIYLGGPYVRRGAHL